MSCHRRHRHLLWWICGRADRKCAEQSLDRAGIAARTGFEAPIVGIRLGTRQVPPGFGTEEFRAISEMITGSSMGWPPIERTNAVGKFGRECRALQALPDASNW